MPPFVWLVVAFGVDVGALLRGVAVKHLAAWASGVFVKPRDGYAVGTAQMAHCGVLAGLVDPHHSRIVLKKQYLGFAL